MGHGSGESGLTKALGALESSFKQTGGSGMSHSGTDWSENTSGTVEFPPFLDARRMKDEELFVACLLHSRYFAFTWVRAVSLHKTPMK